MMTAKATLALTLSTLLFASASYGQTAQDRAKRLFESASVDYNRGAYAEACPKFEEVRKLQPEHLGTAINLVECYEKLGKTGSAWNLLTQSRAKAVLRDDKEKVEKIDTLMASLKGRLARVILDISPDFRNLDDLTIVCGNDSIPREQWGGTLIVDPGKIRIKASTSNRKTWTSNEYEVSEGKPPLTIPVVPDWNLNAPPPQPATPQSSSGLRTVGFVGIGVGGAALVGWGIVGGLMLSKDAASDADGHCNATNNCDEIGTALRLEAKQLGKVATGLLIGGGALALTGIVLVAVAPKPGQAQTGPQASLWFGPGSVGIRGMW